MKHKTMPPEIIEKDPEENLLTYYACSKEEKNRLQLAWLLGATFDKRKKNGH